MTNDYVVIKFDVDPIRNIQKLNALLDLQINPLIPVLDMNLVTNIKGLDLIRSIKDTSGLSFSLLTSNNLPEAIRSFREASYYDTLFSFEPNIEHVSDDELLEAMLLTTMFGEYYISIDQMYPNLSDLVKLPTTISFIVDKHRWSNAVVTKELMAFNEKFSKYAFSIDVADTLDDQAAKSYRSYQLTITKLS